MRSRLSERSLTYCESPGQKLIRMTDELILNEQRWREARWFVDATKLYTRSLKPIATLESLREHLQGAIELEHFTCRTICVRLFAGSRTHMTRGRSDDQRRGR